MEINMYDLPSMQVYRDRWSGVKDRWWPPKDEKDAWKIALVNQGLIGMAINTKRLRLPINSSFTEEDMIQIALMALKRAAELFDPSLGWKWSTYAVTSMRRRVYNIISSADHMRSKYKYTFQPIENLVLDDKYLPFFEDLTKEPDRTDEVEDFMYVDELISGLEPLEQQIIVKKYYDGKSLREIAKELGVSHYKLEHVHKKALSNMRKTVKASEDID